MEHTHEKTCRMDPQPRFGHMNHFYVDLGVGYHKPSLTWLHLSARDVRALRNHSGGSAGRDHPKEKIVSLMNAKANSMDASMENGGLRGTSGTSLGKKPLHFWIRLILGVVFIVASADKIYQPAAFARMVYNYQILPDTCINLFAIVLPWLELLLGIMLVAGLWRPTTVTLSSGLLLAFYAALLFNVARGLDVHCGCFSTSTDGAPATTWYLFRDGVFLLMGAYLFFKEVISRSRVAAGGRDSSG